ncbi:ABC transporter permease [Mesorhizobium atlanticum]
MSLVSARGPKATVPLARWLARNRGALIAAIVFALSLGVVDWVGAGPLTYFDVSFLSSGGATSAIAAMGQTLVVLSGGFDLSAGAVVSLVNVALASSMDPLAPGANVVLWTLAGIGIGMTVGAFNGFFIAWLRMQPIVVTLSTMFILQGVTLLVMDKPGGFCLPRPRLVLPRRRGAQAWCQCPWQ